MDATSTSGESRRGVLNEISNEMISLQLRSHTIYMSPAQSEQLGILPTPSPSPDELVIRARGRKQWSPTLFEKYSGGTPISRNISPTKVSNKASPTRSSPRKRLQLSDSPVSASDCKRRKALSSVERRASFELTLKSLSHQQLQDIIQQLATDNHQVKEYLQQNLPEPDLQPLIDRLSMLKKNIYRARLNNRLTSKTGSQAYNMASAHLITFKEVLMEQGKCLYNSEQWGPVLEYSLLAWSYTRMTPVWDNPAHNQIRESCFKFLAAKIMHTLKKITFNEEVYQWLKQELSYCQEDSKDIVVVLNYLERNRVP